MFVVVVILVVVGVACTIRYLRSDSNGTTLMVFGSLSQRSGRLVRLFVCAPGGSAQTTSLPDASTFLFVIGVSILPVLLGKPSPFLCPGCHFLGGGGTCSRASFPGVVTIVITIVVTIVVTVVVVIQVSMVWYERCCCVAWRVFGGSMFVSNRR